MIKVFGIYPRIYQIPTFNEFINEFKINANDLILTNKFIYLDFMRDIPLACKILFVEDYGQGEPSDYMVTAILQDIRELNIERVIGIGGGTVLDIAKLLCIKDATSADDIYEDKIPLIRDKKLVLVPTTCGTGCEVTCVSVIDRPKMGAKIGKRIEANFADAAVLIPELLSKIPHSIFAYSSIDALIHAMEVYVNPATKEFTKIFCVEAIRLILKNYLLVAERGEKEKYFHMDEFLRGSCLAGIAIANDMAGAVHACAMHFGGKHHVPHGEANYRFLISVFKKYSQLRPEGQIRDLAQVINEVLGINTDLLGTFSALEELLDKISPKKSLRGYGVVEEEIPLYVDKVFETQQRVLIGNYVNMTRDDFIDIYKNAY